MAASSTPLERPYRLAEQRWDTPIAAGPGAPLGGELARRDARRRGVAQHRDRPARVLSRRSRGAVADRARRPVRSDNEAPAAGRHVPDRRRQRSAGGGARRAARQPAAAEDRNRGRLASRARRCACRSSTRRRRRRSPATISSSRCRRRLSGASRSRRRSRHSSTTHSPRCSYGRATKTLLQFSKRFWHAAGRPRAFGSPFDFGALMDANEEQRGRPGILALLAGGSASDATQAIVAKDGPAGLIRVARVPRVEAGGAGRVAAGRLGARSVGARRLRLFDPSYDPVAARLAGASVRPHLLRRRAHQHPLAGLHERRDRERTARPPPKSPRSTSPSGVS